MIWRPYAQMKTMAPPYMITGGHGVYLETPEKDLIDSISSWWCVIHGYQHPEMVEAIRSQAEKLTHAILAGTSNEPAVKLSEKLTEWLPGGLKYHFYSDSGSTGVEVALKMALQYSVNRGERDRRMMLSLKDAYHGDTFGAMEVGGSPDYRRLLNHRSMRLNVEHFPTTIPALEEAFSRLHGQLNSFIVEPLLQGAGGLKFYDIEFLRRARQLCDEFGVLLIFDEVATGMGRTGYRYVSDEVAPDILVLGKALTGGCIGHSVTAANEKVFMAFYGDDPELAFMHGPTFGGNPMACAAALKSIELFERDDYMSKIRKIEDIERRELKGFAAPKVRDVRVLGPTAVIEFEDRKDVLGYRQFAYDHGVHTRPLGNCIYTMPPYIISESELTHVLTTMKEYAETVR